MLSSMAAAPASCMARAWSVQLGRDAVEAGDHRDLDRRRGALEQIQIAAEAGVLHGDGREVVERLGKALAGLVDEAGGAGGLLAQLLLEQREQDDRADAGVRQAPNAVDGVGKATPTPRAGCAAQPHVLGREVHQRSLRASAGNSCPLRVAISS